MSDQQRQPGSEGGFQLSAGINIPPRPALLMALQREMRKEEPDFRRINQLLRRDAGMAGSLLKAANSAFYGARRNVETVEAAILMVGMDQFGVLMTGLITRRVLAQGAMMMARFWDVSEKRSAGMGYLAKQTKLLPPELAFSFGLFCDIGIPLLKAHFPTYLKTLDMANHGSQRFTEIEDETHGINHTVAGAMLAESWGIAPDAVAAIRLHHTLEAIQDERVPMTVRRLVAGNLLVDRAIRTFRSEAGYEMRGYDEWEIAQTCVNTTLNLEPEEAERLCDELKQGFASPLLN